MLLDFRLPRKKAIYIEVEIGWYYWFIMFILRFYYPCLLVNRVIDYVVLLPVHVCVPLGFSGMLFSCYYMLCDFSVDFPKSKWEKLQREGKTPPIFTVKINTAYNTCYCVERQAHTNTLCVCCLAKMEKQHTKKNSNHSDTDWRWWWKEAKEKYLIEKPFFGSLLFFINRWMLFYGPIKRRKESSALICPINIRLPRYRLLLLLLYRILLRFFLVFNVYVDFHFSSLSHAHSHRFSIENRGFKIHRYNVYTELYYRSQLWRVNEWKCMNNVRNTRNAQSEREKVWHDAIKKTNWTKQWTFGAYCREYRCEIVEPTEEETYSRSFDGIKWKNAFFSLLLSFPSFSLLLAST